MSRILKFHLGPVPSHLPPGPVLQVAFQRGVLTCWIAANEGWEERDDRQILEVVGTGWNVPETCHEHVGTAVGDDSVWHVFRRLA